MIGHDSWSVGSCVGILRVELFNVFAEGECYLGCLFLPTCICDSRIHSVFTNSNAYVRNKCFEKIQGKSTGL